MKNGGGGGPEARVDIKGRGAIALMRGERDRPDSCVAVTVCVRSLNGAAAPIDFTSQPEAELFQDCWFFPSFEFTEACC